MKPKPVTISITFDESDIPKGFRLTGEYRRPKRLEWHMFGSEAYKNRMSAGYYKAFILPSCRGRREGGGK